MTHTVRAGKLGDPGRVITGYPTQMRLHKGEDWPVSCDRPLGDADLRDLSNFEEWWELHYAGRLDGIDDQFKPIAEEAWSASRMSHKGTLRRVGWLDQKGRVWMEMPSTADFDGGSLTPLLIDARES